MPLGVENIFQVWWVTGHENESIICFVGYVKVIRSLGGKFWGICCKRTDWWKLLGHLTGSEPSSKILENVLHFSTLENWKGSASKNVKNEFGGTLVGYNLEITKLLQKKNVRTLFKNFLYRHEILVMWQLQNKNFKRCVISFLQQEMKIFESSKFSCLKNGTKS